MRKISVVDYTITIQGDRGETKIPYSVKESLINCMFHPALKLTAREVLLRNEIGNKINGAREYVLLEDAEYEKLKNAFDTIQGFGQNDIELIRRVFDAEIVKVEVAK